MKEATLTLEFPRWRSILARTVMAAAGAAIRVNLKVITLAVRFMGNGVRPVRRRNRS